VTELFQELIRSPQTATPLAAFLFVLLGGLHAAIWWRDREPGMQWMALAAFIFGIWVGTDPLHVSHGPYVGGPPWSWVLIQCIQVLLTTGLVSYLGYAPRWRLALVLGLCLPGLVATSWLLSGQPLLRSVANLAVAFATLGQAILALWVRRREPGAGHGFIAFTLFLIPLTSLLTALSGAQTILLRYSAIPPLLTFFTTLLTVSLLRRRRALEAEISRRQLVEQELLGLNQSLEQRVLERTADLQDVITGLESFNRNVSHDLRGPLGGMSGLAQLALDALERGDPATARDMLALIRGQASSSAELVASLLELARVGEADLSRQTVNMNELLADVVQQLRNTLGANFRARVLIDSVPAVMGDPGLLRPALTNLLSNALKFSRDSAAPEVRVNAAMNPATEELTVTVADNGVGFDPARAEQLFQPFRRLHGRQIEGHGVGLSIVRKAIERQGGRVRAESAPGQGASFHVTLPAATPEAAT
jgi:signal transduction histidine kinase